MFSWHVFWQMHKLQIHKLVSRRDHLNISTMYSVFDWKEFEILSYRQAFLESTEISASEELNALEKAPAQFMALQILSGEGEVQFMLFWKLSGKCHFLLRFCTSNWSETYANIRFLCSVHTELVTIALSLVLTLMLIAQYEWAFRLNTCLNYGIVVFLLDLL